MNVFDEERGPLADQATAEAIQTLAEAGLNLAELRAFWTFVQRSPKQ